MYQGIQARSEIYLKKQIHLQSLQRSPYAHFTTNRNKSAVCRTETFLKKTS